jgi:hypothetical protein
MKLVMSEISLHAKAVGEDCGSAWAARYDLPHRR